jgi:hypothetical protein
VSAIPPHHKPVAPKSTRARTQREREAEACASIHPVTSVPTSCEPSFYLACACTYTGTLSLCGLVWMGLTPEGWPQAGSDRGAGCCSGGEPNSPTERRGAVCRHDRGRARQGQGAHAARHAVRTHPAHGLCMAVPTCARAFVSLCVCVLVPRCPYARLRCSVSVTGTDVWGCRHGTTAGGGRSWGRAGVRVGAAVAAAPQAHSILLDVHAYWSSGARRRPSLPS